MGYAALCKALTGWRNSAETPWLREGPIHPLQQSLKDLDRAYANFFAKRADFPRFKKKGQRDSFRYPDPKQIKLDQGNRRLYLPKLGWLRFRKSREVLGDSQERYRQPVVGAMVRLDSDRARGRRAGADRRCRGHRHGRGAVRHALRWQLPGTSQQLQETPGGTAPVSYTHLTLPTKRIV